MSRFFNNVISIPLLDDLRDRLDDRHLEDNPLLLVLSQGKELNKFSVELYRLDAKLLKSIGSIKLRVGEVWRL